MTDKWLHYSGTSNTPWLLDETVPMTTLTKTNGKVYSGVLGQSLCTVSSMLCYLHYTTGKYVGQV